MTGLALDRHVSQQPEIIAGLLERDDVPALDPARPIVFTGNGTSLHACRVAAGWLRTLSGGKIRPAALDAHDVALTEVLRAEDQVVVVSHRGTKRYPNAVLAKARAVGATTYAVTGFGPAEPVADVVVRTCRQEKASTHTASYTASLMVLGRMVAETLGANEFAAALRTVPSAIAETLTREIPMRAVMAVAESTMTLVTGTGIDAVTADEAALKLKEGTYRWAEGMHTEFALHGTPAVFSRDTAAFLIRHGNQGGRTDDLRGLFTALGSAVLTVGDSSEDDITFAEVDPLVRPLVAVVPFQRLVSAAATKLGANPDLTHVESEPWTTAIRSVTL